VSDSDGGLYDTRVPHWHKLPPLRANYRRRHRQIQTVADLKASLRITYVWLGGYEIVYFTKDGAVLCGKCVREQFREIADSIKNRISDGWRVIGSGYEAVAADCCSSELTINCDHCGKEFGEIA
jgi:hypothetical protein